MVIEISWQSHTSTPQNSGATGATGATLIFTYYNNMLSGPGLGVTLAPDKRDRGQPWLHRRPPTGPGGPGMKNVRGQPSGARQLIVLSIYILSIDIGGPGVPDIFQFPVERYS